MKFDIGDKVVFDVTLMPERDTQADSYVGGIMRAHPYLTIVSYDHKRKQYHVEESDGGWQGSYWKLLGEPDTPTVKLDEDLFTI